MFFFQGSSSASFRLFIDGSVEVDSALNVDNYHDYISENTGGFIDDIGVGEKFVTAIISIVIHCYSIGFNTHSYFILDGTAYLKFINSTSFESSMVTNENYIVSFPLKDVKDGHSLDGIQKIRYRYQYGNVDLVGMWEDESLYIMDSSFSGFTEVESFSTLENVLDFNISQTRDEVYVKTRDDLYVCPFVGDACAPLNIPKNSVVNYQSYYTSDNLIVLLPENITVNYFKRFNTNIVDIAYNGQSLYILDEDRRLYGYNIPHNNHNFLFHGICNDYNHGPCIWRDTKTLEKLYIGQIQGSPLYAWNGQSTLYTFGETSRSTKMNDAVTRITFTHMNSETYPFIYMGSHTSQNITMLNKLFKTENTYFTLYDTYPFMKEIYDMDRTRLTKAIGSNSTVSVLVSNSTVLHTSKWKTSHLVFNRETIDIETLDNGEVIQLTPTNIGPLRLIQPSVDAFEKISCILRGKVLNSFVKTKKSDLFFVHNDQPKLISESYKVDTMFGGMNYIILKVKHGFTFKYFGIGDSPLLKAKNNPMKVYEGANICDDNDNGNDVFCTFTELNFDDIDVNDILDIYASPERIIVITKTYQVYVKGYNIYQAITKYDNEDDKVDFYDSFIMYPKDVVNMRVCRAHNLINGPVILDSCDGKSYRYGYKRLSNIEVDIDGEMKILDNHFQETRIGSKNIIKAMSVGASMAYVTSY